jgi:hypothetical protein
MAHPSIDYHLNQDYLFDFDNAAAPCYRLIHRQADRELILALGQQCTLPLST